jgi:hypothetical protein
LAQWWARSVGEDNISRRQHCSLVERTKSLMVHQHRCGGSRDLLKPRATNIRAIYLSVSLCVHHRVTWFKTDHLRLSSTVDIFPGLIVSKSTVLGDRGKTDENPSAHRMHSPGCILHSVSVCHGCLCPYHIPMWCGTGVWTSTPPNPNPNPNPNLTHPDG